MAHPKFLPFAYSSNLRLLAAALALTCCATGSAWAQSAPASTQTYTVQAGDTLQVIAQRLFKFGGSWQELRDLNAISRNAENRIFPGQTLLVKNQWLEAPALPVTQARVVSTGQGASTTYQGTSGALVASSNLAEGTRLRTGPSSGATIELEDKSRAQLAPNTEVELVQLRKDSVTGQLRSIFRLVAGSLQMAVPKLAGAAADRLVIRTSTATMGIRGTNFRVSSAGDMQPTTSEVLDGRAELTAGGSLVPLPGGFGSKAAASGAPLAAVPLLAASAEFVKVPPLEIAPKTPTTPASFEWASVPGAARYDVTLSSDSQFENILSNTSTPSTTADFAAVPRGFVFIKVRAYDANGIGGYDLTRSLRM